MGAHFCKCDFDLPSADEPGKDVLRFGEGSRTTSQRIGTGGMPL
jgi:hypothetical protein